MAGDERVRFCRACRKNVYNLSTMSRAEAETLVFETEGRVCVRFYQRRDGTVLTNNCPVGLRKARTWMAAQLAGITAVFATVAVIAPWISKDLHPRREWYDDLRCSAAAEVQPFRSFFQWMDTTPFGRGAVLRHVLRTLPPPPVMGEYIADPKLLRAESEEASRP